MRHIVTKESRGFGFVNFLNPNHALKAIEDCHNKIILKNKIKVYSKNKFKQLPKLGNLYVTNLSKDITA